MSSKIADMPPQVLTRVRPKALIATVFVALPAILFYGILFAKAINLPFQDDYEMILDFLNQMAERKSVSAKVAYFWSAQFNEYKLFLAHGIGWLQYTLFGHVNIELLCALGNGSVLLLAILLWKMFLPNHNDLVDRIALFIPVSWLLFQLQYVETLNWAMPSLSNLPVLFFSLGTIYFLVRETRRAFHGALVCLILAVGSLASGMVVIPVGLLILAVNRRYAHLVGWLGISAGCIAAYRISLQCYVITKPGSTFSSVYCDSGPTTFCARLHRQRRGPSFQRDSLSCQGLT